MSWALAMSKVVSDMNTTSTTWTVNVILSHLLRLLKSSYKAGTHGSTSQFTAKLGMEFKLPTLMLEDVEHHIQSIRCYSSEIHLYFKSTKFLKRAHYEFASVDSFIIVTSHQGCNKDGERDPHV